MHASRQPETAHPLNIILLTDALRDVPLTGIGRYALELARGLRDHPGIASLRCFAKRDWVDCPGDHASQPLAHPGAPGLFSRVRRGLPCRALQDRCSLALKKRAFRKRTISLGDHLLHGPNYLLMPFDGPSLATIHDLSFIHFPDYHPPERIKLLERELPKTLCQASRILTVSEFVRQDIANTLGIDKERISVAHNGVDAGFRPRGPEETAIALHERGLQHGTYLLSVATLEPRKNLARLIKAYSRLPASLAGRFPLVLAGGSGWLTQPLEALIHPLERAGTVRRLGYVPEQHLPMLFAGAAGMAVPSIHEGFGLPVLEAMACGVPVLTSNSSSLPEVAGDAALLVDPADEDAICLGLERLLADDDFRCQARQRGLAQAARFTWENCVNQTMAAYQYALGR